MRNIVYREMQAARIEPDGVRDDDDGGVTISGYAAVYGERTQLWFGDYEVLERGCFANSLKRNDVRLLYQHDGRMVVGRAGNGSLKLKEDDKGLHFSARPNMDTTAGRDMVAAIRRGDVDGMSFGFQYVDDGVDIESLDGGGHLYTIRDCNLLEVSPVTWPAYDGTSVHSRQSRDAEAQGSEVRARLLLREMRARMASYESGVKLSVDNA